MEKIKLSDFIANVAEETGLSKKQTGEVVNAVFAELKTQLMEGKAVGFPGFGTFAVGKQAARTMKSFHSGEELSIPAKKKITLKVSDAFKKEVNG